MSVSNPDSSPLPPELTATPATLDDVEAVNALFNRADHEVAGRDLHDPQFFRSIWTRPGSDLSRDTCLVRDAAGELVAAAFTNSILPHVSQLFCARALPEWRGRGLDAWLTQWCETRCRERLELAPANARVVMHDWIPKGHPVEAELEKDGLRMTRHFVKMGMTMHETPPLAEFPEGFELRPVDRALHDRAICRAEMESFRDHWGFFDMPFETRYETWRHHWDQDPQTDLDLWYVAWDGDEIAGLLICTEKCNDDPEMGYLHVMGVRPAWRRRGLATAFLRHGIRALWDRGIHKAGLHADAENLTGAVRIYRKVGMDIDQVFDNWELELRDGEELRVTG